MDTSADATKKPGDIIVYSRGSWNCSVHWPPLWLRSGHGHSQPFPHNSVILRVPRDNRSIEHEASILSGTRWLGPLVHLPPIYPPILKAGRRAGCRDKSIVLKPASATPSPRRKGKESRDYCLLCFLFKNVEVILKTQSRWHPMISSSPHRNILNQISVF